MKFYNKLIRDKIPEILDKKGECYTIEILGEAEYKRELVKKLDEEVAEFKQDMNTEELADILEVVDFLAQSLNSSFEDILVKKEKKAKERGGFFKRIFLKSIN